MRRFYLLAAIVMVGVLSPRAAAACSLPADDGIEGVLYSGAIFVGRVVSVEDLKPSERTQGSFDGRRVTFRVTERFFGAAEWRAHDWHLLAHTAGGGGERRSEVLASPNCVAARRGARVRPGAVGGQAI